MANSFFISAKRPEKEVVNKKHKLQRRCIFSFCLLLLLLLCVLRSVFLLYYRSYTQSHTSLAELRTWQSSHWCDSNEICVNIFAVWFIFSAAPLLVSCYSIIIIIFLFSLRRSCSTYLVYSERRPSFVVRSALLLRLLLAVNECRFFIVMTIAMVFAVFIKTYIFSSCLTRCLHIRKYGFPLPKIGRYMSSSIAPTRTSSTVQTFSALCYAHTFSYWMILTRFNVLLHFSTQNIRRFHLFTGFQRVQGFRRMGTATKRRKEIAVYFMANIPSTFSVVVCILVLTQWKRKTNDKTMKKTGIRIIWLKRFDDDAILCILITHYIDEVILSLSLHAKHEWKSLQLCHLLSDFILKHINGTFLIHILTRC